MSSGPKTTSAQTATTSAPDFLQPGLRGAATATNNAFTSGIEGFNQTAGRDLVGQQLRGDFLTPDSNPFLRANFDRAADLTQTRLASEFAGQGRNIGASLPARSEELQSLSAQLFGNNFANERAIQQNSLNQASTFDPIDQLIRRIGSIAPSAGRTQTTTGSTKEKRGFFDTVLGVGDILF